MLAASMVVSLAACGKKTAAGADGAPADASELVEYEIPEFDTEYAAYSDGAEWGNNFEGSAVYLDGKTAIVTVAVATESEPFSESELATMKKNAKTALDFISDEAKQYGKKAEFFFDEADLNYTYKYDSDAVEDFESEDYDGVIEYLLSNEIDANAIREKYSADGIAYLFLLNGTGDSFASAHWQEDETYFFSEGAYVYKIGYDDEYEEAVTGPNVYAYQLLQLFGAIPLDYPDATYGYTGALCAAVEENYSDDIMYSMFEEDGSLDADKVTKTISPVTAYAVGLADSFDELADNKSFTKKYVCCFTDEYLANTKDGSDSSAYEYQEIYDEDLDDEELDEEDIEVEELEEESVDGEEKAQN